MIKEEDRLALTVKMIDNECHIVPRGFFYRLPDGNIIKAPYFKGTVVHDRKFDGRHKSETLVSLGLSYSEIGNQANFLHISPRYDPTKGTRDRVRCDHNGSIDFLESIDKDLPTGKVRPTNSRPRPIKQRRP